MEVFVVISAHVRRAFVFDNPDQVLKRTDPRLRRFHQRAYAATHDLALGDAEPTRLRLNGVVFILGQQNLYSYSAHVPTPPLQIIHNPGIPAHSISD